MISLTFIPSRRWSTLLLCYVMFLFISSCVLIGERPTSTPGPTPDIPNFGGTPTMQGSLMPYALNCALIKEAKPGPTWYGITIGKSTFKFVEGNK